MRLKIVFSNELKWSFTNPTLIFPLSQGFRLPRRIPPSIVPCFGSTGHPMEARPTPRKGSWWRRKRRKAFDADAHRRSVFDRRFRFANHAYPRHGAAAFERKRIREQRRQQRSRHRLHALVQLPSFRRRRISRRRRKRAK